MNKLIMRLGQTKFFSCTIVIGIFMSLFMSSCVTSKKVIYLQDVAAAEQSSLSEAYQPRIINNDKLSIVVSSMNQEAALPFNTPMLGLSQPGISSTNSADVKNGYIVESDGCINFPVLGRVKAAGLTREELAAQLEKQLEPYLKDRIVNVQFLNFKVTVLGEVRRPGSFTVPTDRITLLEALGMAGDLDILAKRQNVLIIRETNGRREFERLDLRSKKLFESEYFYLQQNDVVYVEPGKSRIFSGAVSPVLPYVLSIISTILTVIAVTR
ncbi:MAG: polysaccharide biosynthesis/export family protein [Marinifilaceae bacterium]